MAMLTVKDAKLRRIVLSNGGQVAVGPIETDDGDQSNAPFTAIRFERAGEETVRFAISAEARAALVSLLTNPEAGEEWQMPSDWRQRITFEWRLLRDEDIPTATAPDAGE